MHAYKVEAQISDSHHLEIDLPASFPSGAVEIIVLSVSSNQQPCNDLSICEFSTWFKQQPVSKRSAQEIEEQIQQERNAWSEE